MTYAQMNTLNQLHADIDARVQTIQEGHADWLCRMGCDGCCRRLAEIPRITKQEWDCLRDGIAKLPPKRLQEISQNIALLAGQSSRPITCPLLDLSAGACLAYAYRPVACRTYGFYVQRDQGLYCKEIESRVADGLCANVIWGNQDAIDRSLSALGDARDLTEWFAHWQEDMA